jgi:membrane-bound serine protease (ClpP class)
LIILGGIYFELQTPGVGFPILAAITAAVFYFAPLYLEGLAANWEILMAVAGFILLAVELLVLPGFGVAGIAGIIMLISAFTFSLVGNDGFNFEMVPAGDLTRALTTVVLSFAGAVVFSVILGKRILKTNRFGKMVLQGNMNAEDGYVSSDPSLLALVGSKGLAQTVLRPSGKVTIDGQTYPANAESGFVEAGKKITVTRFDGISLWVSDHEEI